ncbi:pPIWI_RE_Z domain-containing protein [Streptomyces huasconensis]|uniref:pPIWI_RE_Z domain-containing protein n=1 Tax=Streptomyces huasconensis TaxID=1854574 RepID=UPI0036FB5684
MRDRSSWYQPVVQALGPWPEEYARIRPSLLCQVELALRLLETVAPGHAADGAWTLLGGYGVRFARAVKLPVGPDEETVLSAARHRLWPMRRGRMWRQNLEAYLELPERLRAYRVPADGEPAHRVPLKVAADRFAVYDEALAHLPGFAAATLPQAEAGEHRFMDRRHRRTSVTIPEELIKEPFPGHPLTAVRPATAAPLPAPLCELADVAQWMDAEEQRRGLKAGNWAERLQSLELDTRAEDGLHFEEADTLVLDGLTHLVGMVGAGKSTLMTLLAVWAHQNQLRITLVVGDVAEQLTLTELFRALGLSAAVVQGGTTRPQHTQRLHRRLAARGAHSLLAHTSSAFAHLSTACPLDALRALDSSEPLRYADAPCGALHPSPQKAAAPEPTEQDAVRALARARGASAERDARYEPDVEDDLGTPHACPMWSACPRHSSSRDLVDALIWVANPASLVQTGVPRQLNEERLRYLELACLRSDIVIVDEADRVQMQLDQMFAPSATLVTNSGVSDSWLDQLQTHEIAELARQGRIQLSNQDVERWSASLDVVGSTADRLYAMLIDDEGLREWAQIDYFSAWTLQEKLLHAWYPPARGRADAADLVDIEDELSLYEDEDGLGGDDDAPAEAPWTPRRTEITGYFDKFRDDPLGGRGPYGTPTDQLTALALDVLHTLDEKRTRRRVRSLLDSLLVGAPGPAQRPAPTVKHGKEPAPEDIPLTEEWRELQARRLEFTLVLAALHQRLDRVTFLWPQVEAALRLDSASHELTRRPPLDYAPLLPEAPMGNVLGFQYLVDERAAVRNKDGHCTGTLRFFRCAGVGRELLLNLTQLGARPSEGEAGPHVLLMSGTSWAGTSTRAHVLAPVRAVLKPQPKALEAIRQTVFRTEFLYDAAGQPIRLSGQDPDKRADVLRLMIDRLARSRGDGHSSPLQSELAQIVDQRRRRALLLVGSYKEAQTAATALNEIPRWRGRVRVLAADDAELESAVDGMAPAAAGTRMPGTETGTGAIRRGDLASFADDPDAELLVAPLLAVERGHNILTAPQRPGEERVAAFGTVFFLVRPHPRSDDLSLAVFAINDWATRFVRGQLRHQGTTFDEMVTEAGGLDAAGGAFRHTARGVWRHLLSRPYIYSSLSDAEKKSFVWDQLVTIWQVIGRLVRGGVPARVVFVDAAFSPKLAAAQAPFTGQGPRPRRSSDPGLLVRLRDVLAPYFITDGKDAEAMRPQPADVALVTLLYRPLFEALCTMNAPPTGARSTD